MKRFSKAGILVILTFLAVLTFAPSASARSLSLSQHVISANVNKDGSVDVEEWITYNFSGQYNGVTKNISYKDSGGITNLEIFRASSNDYNSSSLEPLNLTSTGAPESFNYTDENGKINIKLYTPSSDIEKSYVYRYKINEAVKKYNDIAEFYWQFIAADNETPNDNVEVNITVPEGAKKEDLRVFGHGPLIGKSEILDDRSVKLSISYLPPHSMLESRVLFPPSLISDSYTSENTDKLTSILTEEGKWANNANSTRAKARNGLNSFGSLIRNSSTSTTLLFILFLVALYAIRFIYRFITERPAVSYDYYRELPSDYSPAIAGLLVNGKVTTKDISATILDLVRRKHLIIEEHPDIELGFFSKKEITDYAITQNPNNNNNPLLQHEEYLIDWFINDLGIGGRADLKRIQDDIKNSRRDAIAFENKFKAWKNIVKKEAVDLKLIKSFGFNLSLFDGKNSFNLIVSLLVVIYFMITIHSRSIFLIIIIFLIVNFFNGFKKTPNGVEDYFKWKAFKRFLKDFSLINQAEVPSLVIWEHYLVYAVSLGIAKEVIEQLKLVIPQDQFSNTDGLTYLHYNSFLYGDSFSNFDDSIGDINSSAIANSSDSSSGGFGGGFSGGGGGGGGGGSDGGF